MDQHNKQETESAMDVIAERKRRFTEMYAHGEDYVVRRGYDRFFTPDLKEAITIFDLMRGAGVLR
jgi:hypothetical protein